MYRGVWNIAAGYSGQMRYAFFINAFLKHLLKVTSWFILSPWVCMYVHMEQNGSYWLAYCEILYWDFYWNLFAVFNFG